MTQLNYAIVNKAGLTDKDSVMATPGNTGMESLHEQVDKLELVDKPIEGDLNDDEYWEKINREHEEECAKKERE